MKIWEKKTVHLAVARKQWWAGLVQETKYACQKHTRNDLLPPTGPTSEVLPDPQ